MLRSADTVGANHLFVDGMTSVTDLELGHTDQAVQVEIGTHVRVLTPAEMAFYLPYFSDGEVGDQTLRLAITDQDKTDVAGVVEGLPPIQEWPTVETEPFNSTADAMTTYASPVPQPMQ